jgi:hypothetical protein
VLVFKHEWFYPRLPEWTASLEGTAVGEPLIGDFDDGDDMEIIVGASAPGGGSLLYIFSVPSTPGALELVVDPVEVAGTYTTGALCDLDADGKNDIVFATNDGLLHRLEYWDTSEPRFEWPMYRHDERNSGLYQQPVAGPLAESTTWSGSMLVEGDVEVPDDVTLYLAAGTEVAFVHDHDSKSSGRSALRCELIVDGRLHAAGGENWPIVLHSDEVPPVAYPDWYGITLERGSVCTLAYTEVLHTYKSLWAIAPDLLNVHDSQFLQYCVAGVHLQNCGPGTRLADCAIGCVADVGIRADSCHTEITGNTIEDVTKYGIRVSDDLGSVISGNDITTEGKLGDESKGIYVAYADSGVTVYGNQVRVKDLSGCGTGLSFYSVPHEPTQVEGNSVEALEAGQLSSKGMRLYKTNASVRWNQVYGFTQSFHVEGEAGLMPDLGDAGGTDGDNATDADPTYYVYAVSPPSQGPPELMAQMNWWGTDDPVGRKFYGSGVTVVWEPCLESDPYGRGEEPPNQTGEPLSYYVSQNAPNPFNPVTTIKYGLAQAGHVRLVICDLAGRKVRTLVEAWERAGHHAVAWDGTSDAGVDVATGVYFYSIEAGPFQETRKAVHLK